MWDCTNLLLPGAGDNEPAQGEIRGRLGAAHSGGCSACIDRSGTLGVLPQSLTPPAGAVDQDPRRLPASARRSRT